MVTQRKIQPVRHKANVSSPETTQLKRVAAYCRVSTLQEEQDESYETQCEYFRRRIAADNSMILVDIYGDHGISGLSADSRPEFMRMMEDCRNGKVDMIMTKSISRFARNLADCIECVRELRSLGIAVIFEKENLNTLDPGCEMLLSILAALAQEESNTLSQHILRAHEYRNTVGNPIRGTPYGYTKSGDGWVINESEAMRVRTAFNMADVGYRYREIVQALDNIETRENTGKHWPRGRVSRMLTNEVYIGDILMNKTFKPDLFSKKSIPNHGQRYQYYIEGHHDGIIDRDMFERVKKLVSSGALRSIRYGGTILA